MESQAFNLDFSFLVISIMVVFLLGFWFFTRPKDKQEKQKRDRIRRLILGQEQARIYHKAGVSSVDEEDLYYGSLRHRYKIAKLFALAASLPENKLTLDNGDVIAPHSREHGQESGDYAKQLRQAILEKYGIDLETMKDLEKSKITYH